jgi:two-component sensor histidine kinase
MVNELLTNAIKHAFHGVENPAIKLSFFHEKNCLILEYRDNGVGLNLDQLQSEKQGSFGSKLLHILTNKYKGTMTVENKEGTFIRWVLYV